MAVKGNSIEMGAFKRYFTEVPSFSRKRTKINFSEQAFTSHIEPSNDLKRAKISFSEQLFSNDIKPLNERERVKIKFSEHVASTVEPSNGKLISATQIEPILSDRLSKLEARPGNTRPHIINIANPETKQGNEKIETPENGEIQTSKTVHTKCASQYHSPYLDYLKTLDPYTGELCSDPEARLNEIIEEMKSWESDVEDFSKLYGQNNPKLSCMQISETSEHNVDIFGNSSKDVSKIKVDCPHCKKNVVAVRFVPHLSKCMGVHSRRSSRKTRK